MPTLAESVRTLTNRVIGLEQTLETVAKALNECRHQLGLDAEAPEEPETPAGEVEWSGARHPSRRS